MPGGYPSGPQLQPHPTKPRSAIGGERGRSRLLLFWCALDLDDVQAYANEEISNHVRSRASKRTEEDIKVLPNTIEKRRTRREARLQLLCFLRVIESEGVQVARAANLELCASLPAGYSRRNLLDACR